jgi:ubiquinone/menaquinone biosynthesis C-methylase UbiE
MNFLVKQHFDTNYLIYLKRRSQIDIRAFVVREFLSESIKDTIIDFGCGDGTVSLQFLPEAKKITLVDFSESMLNACKKKVPQQYLNRVEFIARNIVDYIPTRKYDIVLLLGVLAHVQDGHQTIKKVCECLKPGGVCIIQITDSAKLLSKMLYTYARLTRRISSHEYYYELREMSFSEVNQVASSMGLLLLRRARYFIPPFAHCLFNGPMVKKLGLSIMKNQFLSSIGSEVILMYKL